MSMARTGKPLITAVVFAAGLLSLGATPACAQNQQAQDPSNPKPAARTYPPVGNMDLDPNVEQDSTPPLQPDTRPLTGVQDSTLGLPEMGHSYWVPGLLYSNSLSSTALSQSTASGWNSTNYIAGNVSLLEAWSSSQLSVNYSGGGYVATDSGQGSGSFHQFGLVQTFKWRRWQLTLLDQFSYLPEAAFGFGAGTGISTPGIGGSLGPVQPGLQNSYQPSQSIFTSVGTRYSNSIATQAAYTISPRASINLAGSYGILRFVEEGNVDSDDVILNGGYNYALGQQDTIGVLYRYTGYRFLGNPQALNDHVVQAAYGRKITGRLALRLFGGPDITNFRVPIGSSTRQLSGSGGVALNYASGPKDLNNLSLSYSHEVGNGSGIQIGSRIDLVQIRLGRQLSGNWHGDFNFGYARNSALGSSGVSQNLQAFDAYYIGGELRRPLGGNSNFWFGYTAQIQTSNQAVCATGTCGRSYTVQRINLGFSWRERPFVLR
jgi:hypothetical protein